MMYVPHPMAWKEYLAKAYTTVPKSWKELGWKIGVAMTAISSMLFGVVVWREPSLLLGVPIERRSPIERMAEDPTIKDGVYKLMQEFFYEHHPHGLMFVSWEELDSLVGLWVRPANKFPGRSGLHGLTPDMRVLGGPFLFGECASTESLAIPGKTLVACPVNNSYDAWGYVGAVVDSDDASVEKATRLLGFLAHRLSRLIY